MKLEPSQGFTLVELMVAIAVLGIVSGLVIPAGIDAYRTQRVNAAVSELAGWLNEVRASTDSKNVSCKVSITTTGTLRSHDVVATATAITPGTTTAAPGKVCGSGNPLRLPGAGGSSRFSVGTSFTGNAFYFTQRGAISIDNTAGLAKSTGTNDDNNLSIRISADGEPPMRCVRLTGMLGLVRIGYNSTTGATTNDCDSNTYEGGGL
jgi:prepilin-type N-terminal cleavage/methylation domain-containing protein